METDPVHDDLLVHFAKTLQGEWVASMKRYPGVVGRGLTRKIAATRLHALIEDQLIDNAQKKSE